MSESLKEVLMRRDHMTSQEADEVIQFARDCVLEDGEDPEDVLLEHFGLELDYFLDLIGE